MEHTKNKFLRFVTPLLLLAMLQACIAVPVGIGEEESFSDEKLTFFEVGKSTKENIAAAMPQPMQFLDGNTWLYAKTRKEARWLVGWIDPLMEAEPQIIGGDITGDVDWRYLVIRFDDSGVVAGYETSKSEGDVGCNRSGVCLLSRDTFMLVAPEEEDRAVKQFDQPGDQCGVYVFGGRLNVATIRVDDRQIGTLFDNKHFIFERINPGSHQLRADPTSHGPIEFTCAAGSSVLFEVNKQCGMFSNCNRAENLRVKVEQTNTSISRQAIAERDWILTTSD